MWASNSHRMQHLMRQQGRDLDFGEPAIHSINLGKKLGRVGMMPYHVKGDESWQWVKTWDTNLQNIFPFEMSDLHLHICVVHIQL